MGGTASKPSAIYSKDPNPKPTSKDTHNLPFIVEDKVLPSDKSPTRRRRFTKKAIRDQSRPSENVNIREAETTDVSSPVSQDAGAQPSKPTRDSGKIETLVREGVTNISKTFKDWTMLNSRASKSSVPVILAETKRSVSPVTAHQRHNNQFNFHHESYIAQSRQEKHSTLDFASPRHLGSVTKQSYPDYKSPRHRDSVRNNISPVFSPSQHANSGSRQQSPDNIPSGGSGCKKETSPHYNKTIRGSRCQSPSYLYSLELDHGSKEDSPEETPMSVTSSSRAHSPENIKSHRTNNDIMQKPSRDNLKSVTKNPRTEWLPPVADQISPGYLNSYDKEIFPSYLPSMQQNVVAQRVEIKPALDYAVIKPKTIRVNGVEYVRKRSDHPLLKQLLTTDKIHERMPSTLRERPERDQTNNCLKVSEEEKKHNPDVYKIKRNSSKSLIQREPRRSLDRDRRKTDEKGFDKKEASKPKTDVKVNERKRVTSPVNDEIPHKKIVTNKSENEGKDIEKKEAATPEKDKKGVETKETFLLENAIKELKKKDITRHETATNVHEKKDTNRQESNTPNVHDNKDTIKQESAGNAKNIEMKDTIRQVNIGDEKMIEKRDTNRHGNNAKVQEKKLIAKDEKDLTKQCKIQSKPTAVSSTGRLYLPSMKFVPTPIATMHEVAARLSACASEKSYIRLSRTARLSPNRFRRSSPLSRNHTQAHTDHFVKERRPRQPTAEQEKNCSRIESKESNENITTIYRSDTCRAGSKTSSNNSLPTSPRSNSPSYNARPTINTSKHVDNKMVSSKEQRTLKEHTTPSQVKDEKSNGDDVVHIDQDHSSPNQTLKQVSEKEKKNEQSPLVVKESGSMASNNSASDEVDKRSSQKSIDVWYSKSVRSKNKMFEDIIERTAPMLMSPGPSDQLRPSRHSSPHSQLSDTPFSKAIKLKCRAISAKRIAKDLPVEESNSKVVTPQVFTPWDSCMMFKQRPSRHCSPCQKYCSGRSQSRHSALHKSRHTSPTLECNYTLNNTLDTQGFHNSSRPKSGRRSPTWEEMPTDGERRLTTPKFPRETYQAMQNLHYDGQARQAEGCGCELDTCNCVEVKKNTRRCSLTRNDNSSISPRCGHNKLDRETVRDFEKKFKNTQAYRSVTGEVCGLPGGNSSCRENHGRSRIQNRGHLDLSNSRDDKTADYSAKRQKRCSSCGKSYDTNYKRNTSSGQVRGRCLECGGPLDKQGGDLANEGQERCNNCGEQHDMQGCTLQYCVHCGGECSEKDNDHHASTQGSSSGMSAKSGQVLPYRKVLKMFEKKSRKHAENASRQWRPQSARQKSCNRDTVKPASHLDRQKASRSRPYTGNEAVESVVERSSPRRESTREFVEPKQQLRNVVVDRRRLRRCDESEDEKTDPHFNRSEQELFKNARVQWMARDRQKRTRRRPINASPKSHAVGSSTKGILKKCKTPPSSGEDSRRGRR